MICEMDALVMLDLIQSGDLSLHPLGALIADIRELLARDWSCLCQHTLREGNFSADILSKLGCDLETEFEVFRAPPEAVLGALDADARGVSSFIGEQIRSSESLTLNSAQNFWQP